MYVLVNVLPLPIHIHMPTPSVQMMSILPSPLKSPVASSLYLVETGTAALAPSCVPFMIQYANCVLLLDRQIKSDLPSPLTSLCAYETVGAGAPTIVGSNCAIRDAVLLRLCTLSAELDVLLSGTPQGLFWQVEIFGLENTGNGVVVVVP